MRPFESVLTNFLKYAGPPDDDAAHLQRWITYGDADKTWEKIFGPFNLGDAFDFVKVVLQFRRIAKEADPLNKEAGSAERETKYLAAKVRRRAIKALRLGKVSPQQFTALSSRIEEILKTPKPHDPLLSVRSDEGGTRQRTIFCRILSDLLHYSTGRWHDTEVQELCEIAFDCDDVTIDMVRSARRESTRKPRR
jgi:hypothetical protein